MREALAATADLLAGCLDVPVWSLTDGELVAALDETHRLQQRLAAVTLALVAEIDGREAPDTSRRCRPCR